MLWRSVRLGIGLRVRVRASSACASAGPSHEGAGPAQARRELSVGVGIYATRGGGERLRRISLARGSVTQKPACLNCFCVRAFVIFELAFRHSTSASSGMHSFEEYVGELEVRAQAALNGDETALCHMDFTTVLNGAVGAALRERADLSLRQEKGAFFTGTGLRDELVRPLLQDDWNASSVCDPACGAGDLLLSFAEFFPIGAGLEDTLAQWNHRFHGYDIDPVFVRAARARLVLAAYNRGARATSTEPLRISNVLPDLRVRDSIVGREALPATSHIVLNPPFIQVPAPDDCSWSKGNVSAAALLLERCLQEGVLGAHISAILPDVLRSGSRYADWRRNVQRHAIVERIQLYGPFDPYADVDVFLLDLRIQAPSAPVQLEEDPRWRTATLAARTVGDLCVVSTGPVVPHRHSEIGEEFAYLHSRNAPAWATVSQIEERRRFSGTVVHPPMVVVRRTSSPSDRHRPIGTIILGDAPVAVENHLLILKPKEGGEETCRAILEALQSPATRIWLDQRIRTRHLTVGAIREIPLTP